MAMEALNSFPFCRDLSIRAEISCLKLEMALWPSSVCWARLLVQSVISSEVRKPACMQCHQWDHGQKKPQLLARASSARSSRSEPICIHLLGWTRSVLGSDLLPFCLIVILRNDRLSALARGDAVHRSANRLTSKALQQVPTLQSCGRPCPPRLLSGCLAMSGVYAARVTALSAIFLLIRVDTD